MATLPNLTKETTVTISLAILIAFFLFAFQLGVRVNTIEAQVENNKASILSLEPKIDELNKNLNQTNINVAELTILLQSVKEDLNR